MGNTFLPDNLTVTYLRCCIQQSIKQMENSFGERRLSRPK